MSVSNSTFESGWTQPGEAQTVGPVAAAVTLAAAADATPVRSVVRPDRVAVPLPRRVVWSPERVAPASPLIAAAPERVLPTVTLALAGEKAALAASAATVANANARIIELLGLTNAWGGARRTSRMVNGFVTNSGNDM
jgi:hypothetical protein